MLRIAEFMLRIAVGGMQMVRIWTSTENTERREGSWGKGDASWWMREASSCTDVALTAER